MTVRVPFPADAEAGRSPWAQRARSPVRILVVDDDPGDVLMIEEALADSDVDKVIDVVSDGQEAMEFLRARAGTPHARAPT